MLTPAQLQALKADIQANPTLAAHWADGNAGLIDAYYNEPASPAFVVWRTNVSRSDIYNNTSAEGTNWSWTFYKNQSVPEQGAWTQMFMGDRADFSKPNLRAGIAAIFTSASAANAAHALAIAKRTANNVEKLFKTAGTGTTLDPATLGYEGSITFMDVVNAMRG